MVWTNSWPSITGCGLICVGAGEERARRSMPCGAFESGETSRLGSRDPVASGVKCGPHGGKKSRMKSSIEANAG
jgi:hypothetical protein